ncbi:MAG: maltodextrin glucosidase [Chloroflexi bacterium]|nr:maltodextrin glucosidase [Chloroflexota bacterium]
MTPTYLSSIHHDGSRRYVKSPSADLQLGDEINIRLRSATDAPIERILLRTCPDGEQFFAEMKIEETSSACTWWQATLHLAMPMTSYRFLLFTSDGIWWYNGSGPHRYVPTDAEDFRLLADYVSPSWLRDSVFYQIFPDRFADGEPASNVREGEFEYQGIKSRARNWGEAQSNWPEAMVEFYGGDLPGVEQHLDYLTDLGVNAIYLNPIFTAYSNHRYDVIDYFNVDPHLGGDSALISLRRATAERGMRFILDIVPNHSGVEHPWFKAALQDANSPTADYFTFHQHPDQYESWLGVRSLPKLNYRSKNLRETIYSGVDSVFRHWLKPPYSVDGWRVDVANMLARHGKDQLEAEVWAGIRQAVKEENPSAYLLGENFFDGSSQLQGDHLDASMNYFGFSNPVGFWLNHFEVNQHAEPRNVRSSVPWPTQALVDSWQASRASIPWQIARQQFNLLGSHDTPRIINILNHDHAKNRLAVAFLMTYVGVPCIYYGDEIGMSGRDALEARNCMVWDSTQWDSGLRAFYQTLIKLRRTSPALIDGGFQVLLAEENVLAYLRDTDEEQIIVIGNRGSVEYPAGLLPVRLGAISDGTTFRELFSGQTSTVINGNLPLPTLPAGVQIWRTSS